MEKSTGGKIFPNVDTGLLSTMFFSYVIYFILFFTSAVIVPTFQAKIILGILTGIASYGGYQCWQHSAYMVKYKSKGKAIVFAIICLYSSIAAFAQRFFLTGNNRPTFSKAGFIYCIVGMLWFVPIIYVLLAFLEYFAGLVGKKRKDDLKKRKVFGILLAVLLICQTVLLAAFWPGGYPNDSVWTMEMVSGAADITDWHPVLYTLFLRLIWTIIPSTGVITAVQMYLYAVLCACILMVGYDRGTSLTGMCAGGAVFLLLPNQAISSIGVVKDFPYTIALLWGTYLLVRWNISDKQSYPRWRYVICLGLDMFLIYGLRHNGIIPFIAMVVWCV